MGLSTTVSRSFVYGSFLLYVLIGRPAPRNRPGGWPGRPASATCSSSSSQPGHLGHGESLSAYRGRSPGLLRGRPALLQLHAARRPRLLGCALWPACPALAHGLSCRRGAGPGRLTPRDCFHEICRHHRIHPGQGQNPGDSSRASPVPDQPARARPLAVAGPFTDDSGSLIVYTEPPQTRRRRSCKGTRFTLTASLSSTSPRPEPGHGQSRPISGPLTPRSMSTLANLHRAVQTTLASGRLGQPVFVRYTLQGLRPPDGSRPAVPDPGRRSRLARPIAGAALRPRHARERPGGSDPPFCEGATALVSFARGQPRATASTCWSWATRGALYHDAGSATCGTSRRRGAWSHRIAAAGDHRQRHALR